MEKKIIEHNHTFAGLKSGGLANDRSIRATQMPNGKIFVVYCSVLNNKQAHIFEYKSKENKLSHRYSSDNHSFLNGAVCSTTNEIYLSGSRLGRTKSCSNVSITRDGIKIRNLPEMIYGRYDHSMTLLN